MSPRPNRTYQVRRFGVRSFAGSCAATSGGPGASGNDIICGGDGNGIIYGDSESDVLYGGPGDDIIYGADGADTISGGSEDRRSRTRGGSVAGRQARNDDLRGRRSWPPSRAGLKIAAACAGRPAGRSWRRAVVSTWFGGAPDLIVAFDQLLTSSGTVLLCRLDRLQMTTSTTRQPPRPIEPVRQ